jgi:drug/metabolite transporter (DMT)-like permease
VAAVASAVCIAQAAVLVRGFPPVHPVTMNAVGMGTAAALLLVGSMMAGEPHVLPQQVASWAAVGYLVVVGWVVVFVLYLVVLRYWAPPGRPTGSCASRSRPCCSRRGWTTGRLALGCCWAGFSS